MFTSHAFITKTVSAVLGVIFLFFVFSSYAEQEIPISVKAKLVSDSDAISPGDTFKLGVLFEIIPGWHIYWKNSGDTGLPTKIEFELPPGFKAGELKWPVPNIYRSAGDITDYGYEESVLLYTEVKASEGLEPGTELDIKAQVSWVSCEEICIPGRADLSLNLPISITSDTANENLFSKWHSALPLKESDSKSPFEIDIKKIKDKKGELARITLLHNRAIEITDLIPAPGDGVTLSDVKIERNQSEERNDQQKTDIELLKKVLPGSEPKDSGLELLVVYQSENKKRSGVEFIITAPDQN